MPADAAIETSADIGKPLAPSNISHSATSTAANPPAAATLEGVTKRYGVTLALDGLSLALKPGEVVALLADVEWKWFDVQQKLEESVES